MSGRRARVSRARRRGSRLRWRAVAGAVAAHAALAAPAGALAPAPPALSVRAAILVAQSTRPGARTASHANARAPDREHDKADDGADHARARPPAGPGVHDARLVRVVGRLADRAAPGRADERPRSAAGADAAERRRRRRGPRVQRRARFGRALRRDDERARAHSSGSRTRTTRRRSGSIRRATTRAPRTSSSSPTTSSTHSRFFARIVSVPSATLDTGLQHYVVNRNDLVARYPLDQRRQDRPYRRRRLRARRVCRHEEGMTLLSAVLGTSSDPSLGREHDGAARLGATQISDRHAGASRPGTGTPPVADRPGFRAR